MGGKQAEKAHQELSHFTFSQTPLKPRITIKESENGDGLGFSNLRDGTSESEGEKEKEHNGNKS